MFDVRVKSSVVVVYSRVTFFKVLEHGRMSLQLWNLLLAHTEVEEMLQKIRWSSWAFLTLSLILCGPAASLWFSFSRYLFTWLFPDLQGVDNESTFTFMTEVQDDTLNLRDEWIIAGKEKMWDLWLRRGGCCLEKTCSLYWLWPVFHQSDLFRHEACDLFWS